MLSTSPRQRSPATCCEARAAQALRDGAGLDSDTLHKLVYKHSTKQHVGHGLPDERWNLPDRAVVVLDEAGMVDTRLLHQFAQIAQAKQWRTILVGDHRQLDAVDAGGMFAELVNDPDVATVELDTLHRFEHDWEAAASLNLRNGELKVVDIYEQHGRIHGYTNQTTAIVAVADKAFDRIPADYIAAGNLTVDYASTINRAQGATVDEAHLIIDKSTNAKQLYVEMTRGRQANHVHTTPPAFDPDRHGPAEVGVAWTPAAAVTAACERQSGKVSAIARRRELRGAQSQPRELQRNPDPTSAMDSREPHAADKNVAAAMRRLERFARRPSQGLGRSRYRDRPMPASVSDRSVRQRPESEAGCVTKDTVVGHQRYTEPDRRGCDPTISVVFALMQSVPRFRACHSEVRVARNQLVAGVDDDRSPCHRRTALAQNGFEERVGLGVGEIGNGVLSVRRMWPGASEYFIDGEFTTLRSGAPGLRCSRLEAKSAPSGEVRRGVRYSAGRAALSVALRVPHERLRRAEDVRKLAGVLSVDGQPCDHEVVRFRRVARLIRNVIHTRTYGYSEDEEYGSGVRSSEPLATPELVLDTEVPDQDGVRGVDLNQDLKSPS